MSSFTVSGQIVDVIAGRIFAGTVVVEHGRIVDIRDDPHHASTHFILPGFVDAHIHIESSMMMPSEFARFAVVHGTVGTVSDPHEIANVLGDEGIELMVQNGLRVPFKFHFGAPACVPATPYETAGAVLDATAIRQLFAKMGLKYLAEVMNFPGVLHGDADLLAKIAAAKELGLPIDGHAPGLRGDEAARYAAAGPSTDHECVTLAEAEDKLAGGMSILIREGSAARNFAALHPLLRSHPDRCMFCSDDLHPDSLQHGHINRLVERAVAEGHDRIAVIRAATLNPVRHYGLPVGLLRIGDPADFIVVSDLTTFRVRQTYIDGQCVAEDGVSRIDRVVVVPHNKFGVTAKRVDEFRVESRSGLIRVIEALDGQLVTNELHLNAHIDGDDLISDIANDVLKIAVVNRYADAPPAVGFIRGFGLKAGAIASTVAHDSHNIVAVGTTDAELCRAVNALIEARGGLAVVDGNRVDILELEVAGLMSGDGEGVTAGYTRLQHEAIALGSTLKAPFMTLSFMALLVIPKLKLSDRGLFDGSTFEFLSLFVDDQLPR
ncbi:adenine deaminase [soil metagenome]